MTNQEALDFMRRVTSENRAIVSIAACSPTEIAEASARGDLLDDPEQMLGYVLRSKQWLDTATAAMALCEARRD